MILDVFLHDDPDGIRAHTPEDIGALFPMLYHQAVRQLSVHHGVCIVTRTALPALQGASSTCNSLSPASKAQVPTTLVMGLVSPFCRALVCRHTVVTSCLTQRLPHAWLCSEQLPERVRPSHHPEVVEAASLLLEVARRRPLQGYEETLTFCSDTNADSAEAASARRQQQQTGRGRRGSQEKRLGTVVWNCSKDMIQ